MCKARLILLRIQSKLIQSGTAFLFVSPGEANPARLLLRRDRPKPRNSIVRLSQSCVLADALVPRRDAKPPCHGWAAASNEPVSMCIREVKLRTANARVPTCSSLSPAQASAQLQSGVLPNRPLCRKLICYRAKACMVLLGAVNDDLEHTKTWTRQLFAPYCGHAGSFNSTDKERGPQSHTKFCAQASCKRWRQSFYLQPG